MIQLTKPLILASNSPRRKQILEDAGFTFQVLVKPTEEDFPDSMPPIEVAKFLSLKKANAFENEIETNIVLTADTIVVVENKILNKPTDPEDAFRMLRLLSGKTHKVITGVSIVTKEDSQSFTDTTLVTFENLSDWEIKFYLNNFKPYDKAGSYGVQDFVGMIGIPKIEGSYFTVMGLPIHKVYQHLKKYIIQ
ncbi:MAG: septum formation protein Maf [Pseudarcicella sp.]|nr:septum formation protein Maf [Pseudarcicella sp.]MBP6410838.1 septum formation protein Maf [Pseudarcicella sp.]